MSVKKFDESSVMFFLGKAQEMLGMLRAASPRGANPYPRSGDEPFGASHQILEPFRYFFPDALHEGFASALALFPVDSVDYAGSAPDLAVYPPADSL